MTENERSLMWSRRIIIAVAILTGINISVSTIALMLRAGWFS